MKKQLKGFLPVAAILFVCSLILSVGGNMEENET